MWRADDTKTAATEKSNKQQTNEQTKNQNQKPIKKENCEIIRKQFAFKLRRHTRLTRSKAYRIRIDTYFEVTVQEN